MYCWRTMTATIIIMGRSARCLGECARQYLGRHVLTPGLCRIEFPPLLLCMTLLSLIATSVKYSNQSKLVSGTPLTPTFLPFANAHTCSPSRSDGQLYPSLTRPAPHPPILQYIPLLVPSTNREPTLEPIYPCTDAVLCVIIGRPGYASFVSPFLPRFLVFFARMILIYM